MKMATVGLSKKTLLGLGVFLVVLAALAFSLNPKFRDRQIKPNILVISFCSMRKDRLGMYGYKRRETTPALDAYFRTPGSVIFDSAYNSQPWINLYYSLKSHIKKLPDIGDYTPIGVRSLGFLRIPNRMAHVSDGLTTANLASADDIDEGSIDEVNFEKDIRASLGLLSDLVEGSGVEPFFLMTHIKYLHYPLIDRFNEDSQWDFFLTDNEKKKVSDLVNHPEKFPDKLPLILLLKNDVAAIAKHPKFKSILQHGGDERDLLKLRGVITNDEFLDRWSSQKDFAQDLEIVGKIYDANLRYLDAQLANVWNLWGDQRLKDNTIVIFVGDHGELHMDHGQLTHGLSVYDVSTGVPLAIHFPTSEIVSRREPGQMHFDSISNLIGDAMSLKIPHPNQSKRDFSSYQDDVVVMRDCANRYRGLRFQGKWKYFVDASSGESFLFDLKSDPEEMHNLAAENLDVVSMLESTYWANYERFTSQSFFRCLPWPGHENDPVFNKVGRPAPPVVKPLAKPTSP